jgi:hypothetical protein
VAKTKIANRTFFQIPKTTPEILTAVERATAAYDWEVVFELAAEGLRRNYLNKPPINRCISESWAKEAAQRGLALTAFTKRKAKANYLTSKLTTWTKFSTAARAAKMAAPAWVCPSANI